MSKLDTLITIWWANCLPADTPSNKTYFKPRQVESLGITAIFAMTYTTQWGCTSKVKQDNLPFPFIYENLNCPCIFLLLCYFQEQSLVLQYKFEKIW